MNTSTIINTKQIKSGMIVEWRSHCVNTGKVLTRKRARVIEEIEPGKWYIHTFGVGNGGGWNSWELYPVD